ECFPAGSVSATRVAPRLSSTVQDCFNSGNLRCAAPELRGERGDVGVAPLKPRLHGRQPRNLVGVRRDPARQVDCNAPALFCQEPARTMTPSGGSVGSLVNVIPRSMDGGASFGQFPQTDGPVKAPGQSAAVARQE